MGLLDKIKHAVTGGAAKVDLLKHNGILAPNEMVYVKVSVVAVAALDSKALYIDLHGEDDLDENVVDKAAEIFNPDPTYTWPVHGEFKLGAGESQVFENAIALPADLKLGSRIWLLRARVQAPGKDPSSAWTEFGKTAGA